MKRNLLIASLLLSGSSLFAQSNYFIGVDYLYVKPNSTVTGISNIDDISDDSSNANYKFGYASDLFRITLNGGERFSTSIADYTSYGLNFDYIFPKVDTFEDEAVKPYIGLRYGLGSLDNDLSGDIDVNEYGVQAGLIFVNQSPYELEFGVAYTMYDGSGNFTNKSGTYNGVSYSNATGSVELDNALSFFVGLNFKF